MADIKVVKNVNPITIRIGQRTVKKVVASQKAATTTLNTLQELENVQDIDITQRADNTFLMYDACLLYTSPSPRDRQKSRMPSSA